jgi:hypothetical protein
MTSYNVFDCIPSRWALNTDAWVNTIAQIIDASICDNEKKYGILGGDIHGLADWQIHISLLSSPLTDKWRHFLWERRHFFLQIEGVRGSFVQEIPRSLNDAADQQHAPSLPFRYSVATLQPLDRSSLPLSECLNYQ